MKKKKVDVLRVCDVWNENFIKISKENSEYYFEIGKEITMDVAEAVAILMRQKGKWDSQVWNVNISDVDFYNVDPSKCLYWLSGGDEEWKKMDNYKIKWTECAHSFQEEFGILVSSILRRSKTLKDVRDGFLKYLNLPILYDFSIEKNLL